MAGVFNLEETRERVDLPTLAFTPFENAEDL